MKSVSFWITLAFLLLTRIAYAGEKIVYVNYPSVNIRANAGTEYKITTSLPLGYPLKIRDETEKWYQVELEDKTLGWISKTMVTDDIPLPVKLENLESELKTQAIEFEQTKKQLQEQTHLNSQLDKKLKETQQERDKLIQENRALQRQDHIKLAGIGIIILLLGWGAGFIGGFFKRQAEDKRFIKMMIEANSLKKPE